MRKSPPVVAPVVIAIALGCTPAASAHDLTFEERVEAQEAIERVRYSHQIGASKPFEEAMPRDVLVGKVRTYLEQSVALDRFWNTPVTAEMLRRELERQAERSRMPERLGELYAALGNDPFLVEECLARAALSDRLSRSFFAFDRTIHGAARKEAEELRARLVRLGDEALAMDPRRAEVAIVRVESTDGEAREPGRKTQEIELPPEEFARWRARAPATVGEVGPVREERDGFAVHVVLEEHPASARLASYTVAKKTWDAWWNEVSGDLDSRLSRPVAARSDRLPSPARALTEDTRSPESTASCLPDDAWYTMAPGDLVSARFAHTAVWTGNLMVIWGGWDTTYRNTGGRYDPATDTWTPTSTASAAAARAYHTAVWTGSRMIVWGGYGGSYLNSGGQYDPATDTWVLTTTAGAAGARAYHTAVWAGARMIVWGGYGQGAHQNTGGRYDPATNTWASTSTASAPSARAYHTAVWTGTRMVVWGGYYYDGAEHFLGTGGRYDPVADSWTPTSTVGAASARAHHTAVWTGSRMIVWGGYEDLDVAVNSGGRYDPATDTWVPTSTANAPTGRDAHTAVWAGNVMVVWGGFDDFSATDTGGRYDPTTDTWASTSTVSAPSARGYHTAVWTGSLMFVWGGSGSSHLNTGGRYVVGPPADQDGDGFRCDVDCDDGDLGVYPGAPQLCDGVNNDCGDPSWPAVPSSETDPDQDGHVACAPWVGTDPGIVGGGDCTSGDGSVYPGAPQLCDGKNDDCSDPLWPAVPASEADADGDGFRICAGDCNDGNKGIHPGATEACNAIDDNCSGETDEDGLGVDSDADGVHNACDNCPTDSNQAQEDYDRDRAGDACDNCRFDYNLAQSDFDEDDEGDLCDLDDGLIYVYSTDSNYSEWQEEAGYETWNSYKGDLAVLRQTGVYTQAPGSNELAGRACGLVDPWVEDLTPSAPGKTAFFLATGVASGVECGLGKNSAGEERANTNPCP